MAWRVELSEEAHEDLAQMRAFDHRRVLSEIDRQLTFQPDVEAWNKKCLGDGVSADFEYVPPLWELRVGEYRAFYEFDAGSSQVYVHAVRRKPPGKTTAEVLNEND